MVALCAVLIAGVLDWPLLVHADTGSNWTGAYYGNRDLQGGPAFYRIDPAVVFNWGPNSPGPGVGSQNWSARWTTVQYLNAGTYRFTITADDGVRAYIDGQMILDAWRDQAPTTYYVNVQVVAGNHALQVDYYQAFGDALISVSWDFLQAQSTAWTAQYFNNPDLAGGPIVTRLENSINYFWGTGSPGPFIPADNFSARWTATLPFAAGTYRFTLAGGDGVRLFIDNLSVINQWQDQSLRAFSIDVSLSAGLHTLRVEYYERTNQATVRLDYQVAVGPPPFPGSQSDQWYGEYFGNVNLQGTPWFVRYDGRSGINFNWSIISPTAGFPRENISARWTRQVCVPGRPYTFYFTADDGVRFYIDSTLILDEWRIQAETTFRKPVDLTVGCHIFRLEYFQASLNSVIRVTWDPPDGQSPALPVVGVVPPSPTGVAAVVNTGALNVRNGPGIIYDILTRVYDGQTLALLARSPDNIWARVTTFSGVTGWVNAFYIRITAGNFQTLPVQGPPAGPPPAPVPVGVRGKLTSGLRFRTGPDTNYPQIGTIEWGSIVDIVGRNAARTWLQVQFAGQTGWIYAPYVLIVAGNLTIVPVTG
jgi:uncharacterized protein YraI